MEAGDPRTMRRMLQEPVLAALAHEAVRDYIDFRQLSSRTLPPGLSLEETWELLGVIRHIGATTFPIHTLDGRPFWYCLNVDAQRRLRFITRHCKTGSVLHQKMLERDSHRFLMRSRIQEAVATCQLDGVIISEAAARGMLQEGRSPRTPAERLVRNSFEMLRELDTLKDEPFTPDLVRSLYDQVTHGVDVADIPRGPRKSNLAGTLNFPEAPYGMRNRDILGEICDYANGKTGDPTEPAVIKSYMILSAMAYWRPLGDLNDSIGRHLLRLFALKREYPVLGYLSTSRTMLQWFDGTLKPGTTRFSWISRTQVMPGSIDGTEDIITHLELTTSAIQRLLGELDRAQRAEEELRSKLDTVDELNYRQRAVLARALAHPAAEFRIRPHQTAHRVVYQTARADLLDLEARGFLRREKRGKAFLFRPAADLETQLRGPARR